MDVSDAKRLKALEEEIARLRDENASLQASIVQTLAVAEQAVESAEQAAEEAAKKAAGDSSDNKMLALISRVAMDAVQPPKTGT